MNAVLARLAGKSIFLTGGTGFVGCSLLSVLKKSEVRVTVLSRDPNAFLARRPELQWKGLRILKGDIANFEIPSNFGCDYLLHGANPSSPPATPEELVEFRRSTVMGTNHVFAEIGSRVRDRVLYVSSGGARLPTSPYAIEKQVAENLCAEWSDRNGLDLAIARVYTFAGPYLPLDGRFALGQFIRSAKVDGKITIRSDGTPKRSYLDARELSEWLLTLLVAPDAIGPYDVGSDDPVSILEMARIVASVWASRGKSVSVEVCPSTDAALAADYLPDVRNVAKQFHLHRKKSSEQVIRETTSYMIDAGRI